MNLNIISHCLFLAFMLFVNLSFAQKYALPDDYFRSPLDIPLYLSGTFGEPRSTHFHTGIDIKTQGVEGKNIYAIADGYISRINVSPYGYGNALYITHPNGYVSVYAHLQQYAEAIDAWIIKQQEQHKSFALNIENIEPSLFPVKKGMIIAKSGNSGGSGGPHLHFEIRDSLEHPINPLHFAYDRKLTDNAKPNIYNVFLYHIDEDGNPVSSKKVSATYLTYGNYKVNSTQILNSNKIGVGVHTVDLFTGTSNKNGVYEIKLFVNDTLHYHYRVDELDFNTTKHVYSHCDYWQKRGSNNSVHKCFVEKGNKLKVYPYLIDKGIITLNTNESKALKIEVKDFHKNTSTIHFDVKQSNASTYFSNYENLSEYSFKQDQKNIIAFDDIRLMFHKNTFFTDLNFDFQRLEKNSFGYQYIIHDAKVPVADYYDISILAENIDTTKVDKYYIAYLDYYSRKKYVGGKYSSGFISTKTRAFGTYFIAIDTLAPTIKALNIYENKKMTGHKEIRFTAKDSQTGIAEYNTFVNGKWVLTSYDAKNNLFIYTIDDKVVSGKNTIEFVVLDNRNNAKKITYTFYY